MTTTLRPAGPEERAEDGGRSRTYDIRVNSRRVGSVRLRAVPGPGGPPGATPESRGTGVPAAVGRVEELRVEPGERRRGRATVALLAAEEILRGWGCARAEAGVAEEAAAGLALASALGYREYSRHLVKEVSGAPEPPASRAVRPMDEADFGRWRVRDRVELERLLTGEGLSPEEAARKADASYRSLLPEGSATPGAVLSVLSVDGEDVGTLWVVPRGRSPRPDTEGWVYAVEVFEERRGRGHGRELMLAAERACVAAGSGTLGLNVHAGNVPAHRLYAGLGYRPVERHLRKRLA
ncbi:GNAT family N-acetyltransferase [Streptomyces sp. AJS327]|uniref:GNAT family N-acetyltransferase n=1 Tax=Streptomyces sp. AJS327 TaxID=2545265 RepID=UPI0015DE1A82|nr:GNAT family N-acetyltransferase [Streptomyces sp. AJS327]MBA0050770.1 GNAT family N-acetyltransferase [Streptomyces sp. AJS327]